MEEKRDKHDIEHDVIRVLLEINKYKKEISGSYITIERNEYMMEAAENRLARLLGELQNVN